MKVFCAVICCFLCCLSTLYAQNKGTIVENANSTPKNTRTIVGKVLDKASQTALEYSTVTVFSQKDSVIVTGSITDSTGWFSIPVTITEPFFIKIEYIAYHPHTIRDIWFPSNSTTLNMGQIELSPSAVLLEGVELRTEKSALIMNLDKRIFHVGKDLVSQGGTAEDILRNVPGVWVDINGEVSLRSSGGVRVLLDGQTSLMLTGKNANGLRQLQAASIERIEIITNPSARYEAEGMAGIINIVLKKSQNKGVNGAVHANVGNPENYGLGFNMNYLKNKVNFFAGAGIWHINRPGIGSYRNRFYDSDNSDSTLYSNMDRTHARRSTPFNITVGADYYLNRYNTFTASFAYRGSQDKNHSTLVYKDAYGTEDSVFLITEREEDENGDEQFLTGFLRHRKSFDKKGHSLTSEVRYENELENELSLYQETYFDGVYRLLDTTSFDQIIQNASDNDHLIAKSDYILPLGKEAEFEAGFQSSFRTITDDYNTNAVINNVEVPDTNFTNDFRYHEVIHGVYANYGNKINKFSFQTGLRVEYSDVESGLKTTEGNKRRRYLDVFPSAFLGYDIAPDNGVQLSYSRRIERPTFLDVSPFFTLRDRRNIWQGNPDIRPEYTHAFELSYIRYGEIGTMSAIAYYRVTDDVIKRIQRVYPEFPETTVTQTENLDIKINYGIEVTYALRLTPWWQLNGDINFFHSFSEGTYDFQGQEVYVGGKSFSLRSKTISRLTLWERLNIQLTAGYTAPRRTTQGINRAMFALDFAASIDVLENNGTITLGVWDVFNSRRRRSFSEDETFYSADNFLWRSRALILSFHYRLNQRKKQSQIYASPITEDDEERF